MRPSFKTKMKSKKLKKSSSKSSKALKSLKKRLTKRKNQPEKRNRGGFLSHKAKRTWEKFLIQSGLKEKPIVKPGEFGQRNTYKEKLKENSPEKSVIQGIPKETPQKNMRVEISKNAQKAPSEFYLGGFN